MQNNWEVIPGFGGRYEVSDTGLVRSLSDRWGRVHLLRPTLTGSPEGVRYRQVHLRQADGVVEHPYVHRLVLLAFVGPRPSGQEGRHLNGDPLDNRLENLAYGSHGENILDSVGHGTHNMARKTHCGQGHPYDAANTMMVQSKGSTERRCRICYRANSRRYYAAKRRG